MWDLYVGHWNALPVESLSFKWSHHLHLHNSWCNACFKIANRLYVEVNGHCIEADLIPPSLIPENIYLVILNAFPACVRQKNWCLLFTNSWIGAQQINTYNKHQTTNSHKKSHTNMIWCYHLRNLLLFSVKFLKTLLQCLAKCIFGIIFHAEGTLYVLQV